MIYRVHAHHCRLLSRRARALGARLANSRRGTIFPFMPPSPNKLSNVLLIEDSEDDAFLFGHAVSEAQLGLHFEWLQGVEDAINHLEARRPFCDRAAHPFPDMIFTDLKMPGLDGFAFLEWQKAHAECAVIPTIVLSSSYMEADIVRAYQLGANAFMSKPCSLPDLVELIRLTFQFWSSCQRPEIPPEQHC